MRKILVQEKKKKRKMHLLPIHKVVRSISEIFNITVYPIIHWTKVLAFMYGKLSHEIFWQPKINKSIKLKKKNHIQTKKVYLFIYFFMGQTNKVN